MATMKIAAVLIFGCIAWSFAEKTIPSGVVAGKRTIYDYTYFERAFCEHGIDGHGHYGKKDGNYPHPQYCEKFITCEHFEHHSANAKVTVQSCPFGLFYNSKIKNCDWPRNVDCFLYQGKTCFGAKRNKFGRVRSRKTGYIKAVKLIHLDGYVSCHIKQPFYESFWGCNSEVTGFKYLVNTWVTTKKNRNGIIFPVHGTEHDEYGNYYHEKYNQLSPYIKWYSDPLHPTKVHRGDQLRIWYGEDLFNIQQRNNGGRHCIEVYALYSFYKPFFYLDQN